VNTINSKITAISYDGFLKKTTINSDSYINSITCASVATNTGGDIQTQITNLQSQINTSNTSITTINSNITSLQSTDTSLQAQISAILNKLTPVGTIITFAGNRSANSSASWNDTTGWLLCDGWRFLIDAQSPPSDAAKFDALKIVLGTKYSTDGVSVQLPDLRGLFVRGAGTNTTYGSISGKTLGSFQDSSVQDHYHYYKSPTTTISATQDTGTTLNISVWDNKVSTVLSDAGVFTSTGTAMSNETRPKNISLNYLIKY
jgi:uncharacterized coiled-coil protein SlyX